MFGMVLGAAGIARIVEICFVLRDAPTESPNSESDHDAAKRALKSFQHMPPFVRANLRIYYSKFDTTW